MRQAGMLFDRAWVTVAYRLRADVRFLSSSLLVKVLQKLIPMVRRQILRQQLPMVQQTMEAKVIPMVRQQPKEMVLRTLVPMVPRQTKEVKMVQRQIPMGQIMEVKVVMVRRQLKEMVMAHKDTLQPTATLEATRRLRQKKTCFMNLRQLMQVPRQTTLMADTERWSVPNPDSYNRAIEADVRVDPKNKAGERGHRGSWLHLDDRGTDGFVWRHDSDFLLHLPFEPGMRHAPVDPRRSVDPNPAADLGCSPYLLLCIVVSLNMPIRSDGACPTLTHTIVWCQHPLIPIGYTVCGGNNVSAKVSGILHYVTHTEESDVFLSNMQQHIPQLDWLSEAKLPDLSPMWMVFFRHWKVTLAAAVALALMILLTYLFGPAIILALLKLIAETVPHLVEFMAFIAKLIVSLLVSTVRWLAEKRQQ
ncbi:hypothetical protein OSTOST_02361 [Ostertagia ostertagi]